METLRSKYLLQRYLDKTATPAEIDELMAWIEAETDPEILRTLVDRAWDDFPQVRGILTEEESEQMLRHVLDRDAKDMPAPRLKGVIRTRRFLKAAAVLAVLIASGIVIKTQVFRTKDTGDVSSTQQIVPGRYQATLTLSNGTTLVLDSNVQNGVLLSQGGSQIIKLDSGELVYRPHGRESSGKAGKQLYNTLSTPRSGQYRVTLPDGTKAWLNASSSIRYPIAFQGAERRVVIQGEAYFEVNKDGTRPFVVEIRSQGGREMGSVMVLGTDFDVNAYMDESTVKTTLLDGAIRVDNGEVRRLLKPGDQATIPGNGDGISVTRVKASDVIAWKDGFFRFRGEDINVIMKEVARWYDVEVIYEQNEVPVGRYSGVISRNTPLAEVLKILETGGFRFTVKGRQIRVGS
jgi:ferric-dicitrate binding protein FerR (iron transport regulator)